MTSVKYTGNVLFIGASGIKTELENLSRISLMFQNASEKCIIFGEFSQQELFM